MSNSPDKQGKIYLLWAEMTNAFKIGFSKNVNERASAIQSNCPIPIRIVAEKDGYKKDEFQLHSELNQYKIHGEWFSLPEHEVINLLHWFGIDIRATIGNKNNNVR